MRYIEQYYAKSRGVVQIVGEAMTDYNSDVFGIVIWSSDVDGTAIIWCEDHKELAIYRPDQQSRGISHRLNRNDHVWIETRMDRNFRFVTRLIENRGDRSECSGAIDGRELVRRLCA